MNNWHDARRQATRISEHMTVKITFVPLLLKNETFWQIYVATRVLGALIFEIFAFDIAGLCDFFLSKQVYMIFGSSGFIHNALGRQHNYFERHEKNKASTKILVSEIHRHVGLVGRRTNITSLNFGNVFCIFFLTSISHCAYCLALKLCCLIKFSLSIYVVSK